MTQAPNRNIFLAGAAGAVGRPLCRLLVADGWRVVGTTRSREKAAVLQALGVEPVVVDVFDAEELRRVVTESRPFAVIHQLTDLPPGLDPARMPEARERTTRLRDVGTRNLVSAAVAAGAERLIAQSIAFAYAPGSEPFSEGDPLDAAAGSGIAQLETQVLDSPFEAIVLRYGRFYGPGTGIDTPPLGGPVHVEAAADAARRSLTRGRAGIYNITEEDGTVSCQKARRELGWDPAFRVTDDGATF
jgi:nucleoside-diphosphate-sugar epimerase